MTFTVNLELGYEFDVKANAAEVFAVLADVPVSASFYPGVDKLVDLGGGSYRWEMKKIGVASMHLQTVYASRYVANKSKGTVVWSPIESDNNTQVSGSWKIKDKKKFTHIELRVEAEITLPLPSLMKLVATPAVEAEFEKLTEQYIANLIQRFGGEA